jgi:predicted transcriptional regulator
MDLTRLAFWMTVLGTVCWAVCFWWMHRISRRQDQMLNELREQAHRIEKLAREEHDLIREVHPQVGEIKESIEAVAEDVAAKA